MDRVWPRRAPSASPTSGLGGDGDETLLARGRSGDRAALDKLARSLLPTVERAIARLVGPSPDLEDLVQTALIETLRSLPRFRGEALLSTWATRIAVNVTYHHLRYHSIRRTVPLELVPVADEPAAPAPPADEALDGALLHERLHRLLDRIKPKKRIAFLLYTVGDHSVEEIAALTGSSRVAVKSQLFFARRELQKLVQADPLLAEAANALLRRGGGQ